MWSILRRHTAVLLFGAFQIFFSAPGQTFLISLFVPHIFQDLGVSITVFAGLYSAATLAASLLLNPAGRLIDRFSTQRIVIFSTGLMAAGCWLLAASSNVLMVFLSFFTLRLVGQGVYSLTATTLIIKKFQANRGKALGLVILGFPFSEALYPGMALCLIAALGWKQSYILFGLSNLLLMLPLQLTLLQKAHLKEGKFLAGEEMCSSDAVGQDTGRRDWTTAETLKDVRFYLLLLASCLPPMVVTGLFFHQAALFNSNGWPIALAATGFGVYALIKALGSVTIGPVVDRYGPLGPFVLIILLLGAGTLCAGMRLPSWGVYIYFALIGAALGFSSPVMNVVWPRFYGVKHMGSIKGVIATARNGFTALGPLPPALLMDAGWTMDKILRMLACFVIVMAVLPLIVWKMDRVRTGAV